ncbi:MAG: hypothetical protein V7637_6392 [Mycobacteriales bacterium]
MVDIGTDSYYAVLGIPPDATQAEIRKAHSRIGTELNLRQRNEPENRAEVVERRKYINGIVAELARPAKRAEYDRANADLRFLTVRDAAAPLFADRGHRVDVLRQAITAHLEAAGVPARPVSDLDRTDFRDDETPNALLDQLLRERPQ